MITPVDPLSQILFLLAMDDLGYLFTKEESEVSFIPSPQGHSNIEFLSMQMMWYSSSIQ
jgi:hypothetical protein